MVKPIGKRTKQSVIDEVCLMLGIGPFSVSAGSTEPSAFFHAVAMRLGVVSDAASTKSEISREIVTAAGLKWDASCDSSSSNSGGGGTVTLEGLMRLEEGVKLLTKGNRTGNRFSNDNFDIDIRPKASALRIFRSLTFKPWYALGEFIDNSITSAALNAQNLQASLGPNYSLQVRIKFDQKTNSLEVSDNAAGIAQSDLARALATSEPPIDTSKGLSLHGVGMKAASFWWGRKLEIETHPLDELCGWTMSIDLAEIGADDSGLIPAIAIPHRGFPGTIIRVSGLWDGIPKTRTSGSVQALLPSIYRAFIGGPDSNNPSNDNVLLRLFYNDQELSYSPPALLKEPFWPSPDGPGSGESIFWRDQVRLVLEDGFVIEGWVGLLERMSRNLAGFVLQYRGKGIAGIAAGVDIDTSDLSLERGAYRPERIFGQPGGYIDQTLVGEFDVSAFGKSITTDSVTWTAEQESSFVEALTEFLKQPRKDYLSQALNVRRRKRTQGAIKSDQVVFTEEVESFEKTIVDGGTSHGDEAPNNEVNSPIQLDLGRSLNMTLADFEGHIHKVTFDFSSDPDAEFLEVIDQNAGEFNHHAIVNDHHLAFSDLPPLEGDLRRLFLRFALFITGTEIFLSGSAQERSRFRRKMNALLDKRGRIDHKEGG